MATDSTTALEAQLRTYLLTFAPLSGGTLASVIGVTATGPGVDGRLYWDQAPDNITSGNPSLWGVMSLRNTRRLMENPERATADLEIQWFARPRSAKATITLAADTSDQAMLRYRDASDGIVWCEGMTRSPMPPFPAPADRDLAQIVQTYSLVCWMSMLTQYHDS